MFICLKIVKNYNIYFILIVECQVGLAQITKDLLKMVGSKVLVSLPNLMELCMKAILIKVNTMVMVLLSILMG